jgi:hypothetical protein
MMGVLSGHPDAELVAVCDKDRRLLDIRRREPQLRGSKVAFCEDFEEFFGHDMDAVVLAK